jgi:hypothetical protein
LHHLLIQFNELNFGKAAQSPLSVIALDAGSKLARSTMEGAQPAGDEIFEINDFTNATPWET